MEDDAALAARIALAYDWHRTLGARVVEAPQGRFVVDVAKPEVWDCNHLQRATARAPDEIDALLAQMERQYAHTRWRVVHTDAATPDAFVARLAFEDFRERFVTIQMARQGPAFLAGPPARLRLVETPDDWAALARLVRENHEEGLTTGGIELEPEYTAAVLHGYRAKSGTCRFHLVDEGGTAVGYGSCVVAPNGLGMIEDVFTARAHRGRGVGGGLIAALGERLNAWGCETVFLGALADREAKGFYARLGFRPVALARLWAKKKL